MDASTRRVMLDRIRDAGVVGAGGGGFPTHVKYDSQVEVVIANGAECEPLARVDRHRMATEPLKVLGGLKAAMEITGAARGVIGLKRKYEAARRALGDAISAAGESIELSLLDDTYPAGDEFVLVREILGRVIPEFGLPLDVGALVSNVSTLIDVAEAADHSSPVTHRFVSVAGEVSSPATFRVPLGTPFSALVQASGGARVQGARLLAGGPMMGTLADPAQPVLKTTSQLLVLPPGHPVVARRLTDLGRQIHLTRSACLKCMLCTEVCPRYLLGHRLYPDRLMRCVAAGIGEDTRAFAGVQLCSECGLCSVYGCVMGLDPCAMNRELKARIRAAGLDPPSAEGPEQERTFGPLRRVPSARLIARLGLADYDRPAPIALFDVQVPKFVLPLKQHAGIPGVPMVEVGQRVEVGDLLAEIPAEKLGARVHASIRGVVSQLTEEAVTIEAE